MIDMSFVGLPS